MAAIPESLPAAALTPRGDGRARVWILTAGLAAAAVTGGVMLSSLEAARGLPLELAWWQLAPCFLLAEIWVAHLHVDRGTHTFSLSEVPLVVGLFLAPPAHLLLAILAGSGLALALVRRQPPVKLAFNLAKLGAEATIAALVFRGLLGSAAPLGPRAWIDALAALTVAAVFGTLAITAVISVVQGRPAFQHAGAAFGLALGSASLNTCLGVLTVIGVTADPAAAWLLAAPVALLAAGYRTYVEEHQKSAGIEHLYESSRLLQASIEVEAAIPALLAHLRRVLRADIAEAVLFPFAGTELAFQTRLGPGDQVLVMAPLQLGPADLGPNGLGGESRLLSRRGPSGPHPLLAVRGYKDGMLVPLRGMTRQIGALLVADRHGELDSFGEADLRMLETIAGQASVSLENGRLEQSLTHFRQLEERLTHRVLHDPLTQLANRSLLVDRIERSLSRRGPSGHRVALLLMDLDGFKAVNDTRGHDAGDRLLALVAERLLGCLRPEDTAARLGGDEFAVLLESVADEAQAVKIARRIIAALQAPFAVAGGELRVQGSVGLAIDQASATDAARLMRNADLAMYAAKRAGKSRYRVFEPAMESLASGRRLLREDLEAALAGAELRLLYQPVHTLADGLVAGVEALLRWEHPVQGTLAPDQFLALAEETGLILQVGEWALREACAQVKAWQLEPGFPGRPALHLDVSIRQLTSTGFLGCVDSVLGETGLAPCDLVLELAEPTTSEDRRPAVPVIRRLRDRGVRLAVDGFGRGTGTLAQLRELPADALKVDRRYTPGSEQEGSAAELLRGIGLLGRSLGMELMADGVDSAAHAARLAGWGFARGQGAAFGPALPAPELALRFLAQPATPR